MTALDLAFVARRFPRRPDNAHKGSMGSLCCVTGSYGYAGAAVLCARAALRSGVGLVYQALPENIYPIFTLSAPEAVCIPLPAGISGELFRDNAAAIAERINTCTAAVIGCGMQDTENTRLLLSQIIRTSQVPMVIDADGLNALSHDMGVLHAAQTPLILTPHPKEFSRLTGLTVREILNNRESAVQAFCARYPNTVLVLKGHRTLIASKGKILVNTAGNPGMAKGGSGDVLSGIIGSLLAQGAAPADAAAMGVHIHALAGDCAAESLSRTAMLPGDIIEALPNIYKQIEEQQG